MTKKLFLHRSTDLGELTCAMIRFRFFFRSPGEINHLPFYANCTILRKAGPKPNGIMVLCIQYTMISMKGGVKKHRWIYLLPYGRRA